MKNFIIKILLLFSIVIIADQLFGYLFPKLIKMAKSGDTRRNEFICHEVNSDILIFGSSRATRHYNPLILSDSLGLTCYNCGQDGNGIIFHYGFFSILSQRYNPKLIIYDITPNFDLFRSEDDSKYLGLLRPYYNESNISDIFDIIDPYEKYKMRCNLYKYNTKFIQIISDNMNTENHDNLAGFFPINKPMDTLKIKKQRVISYEIDPVKIKFLKLLVENLKSTKIVFCVSPIWYGMDQREIEPIRDLCNHLNLNLIDFSNNNRYVHNNMFFFDGYHLNAEGADEYTRELATCLKKCCKLEDNKI